MCIFLFICVRMYICIYVHAYVSLYINIYRCIASRPLSVIIALILINICKISANIDKYSPKLANIDNKCQILINTDLFSKKACLKQQKNASDKPETP